MVGEDDDHVVVLGVDVDLAFVAGGAAVVADEGDAVDPLVGEAVGVLVDGRAAWLRGVDPRDQDRPGHLRGEQLVVQ